MFDGEVRKGSVIPVRHLDYIRLMRQGLTTNSLSFQGNIDHIKSALYYANLGRAFRNYFYLQNVFPFIHKYDGRENH